MKNIEPLLMYIGHLEYTYIRAPIKKLYLKWKYRKVRNEVKKKYTEITGLPMLGDTTVDGTRVVCDHTNNSVEDLEKGIINLDYYPPKPIEYIKINFTVSSNGEYESIWTEQKNNGGTGSPESMKKETQ